MNHLQQAKKENQDTAALFPISLRLSHPKIAAALVPFSHRRTRRKKKIQNKATIKTINETNMESGWWWWHALLPHFCCQGINVTVVVLLLPLAGCPEGLRVWPDSPKLRNPIKLAPTCFFLLAPAKWTQGVTW